MLINKISSPLLGLQVGQPSSFSLLPTSIKDREDQLQEAGGHGETHQEDLLPSPRPPGRTAFILLPPPYLNKDREGQIQEAGGTVRLIKRISSPLIGLQVGQPSSFSLLPTSIKDRDYQIQEA